MNHIPIRLHHRATFGRFRPGQVGRRYLIAGDTLKAGHGTPLSLTDHLGQSFMCGRGPLTVPSV